MGGEEKRARMVGGVTRVSRGRTEKKSPDPHKRQKERGT